MNKQISFCESSRREFLIGLVAGSAGLTGNLGSELLSAEVAAIDAARRQAAKRRRRVIYNNDGDDIWAKGADSVKKFLAIRHTPLIDTHVDSIYYCTTQSFNHFSHDTHVAEIFQSKTGKFADNNLSKFIERKTDGLRMSNEFARKHGLESIWTLRMNDIHDAWTPAFVPKWKKQDSARIMSTLEKTRSLSGRARLWSLVDFEHPDVAPRLLQIIEEVLKSYDVDGVELDFLRAPFYFRTTYEGKPATDKQIGVLSKLVKQIRELVLRESARQGKPLLLAARVPTTIALCRKIGIDVNVWLEDSLIDLLSLGGGYVTFDVPVRELIELAHKHDVPAYPCISQSGLMYREPRGKSTRQPPEAWFGAASRLWEEGADGIYTFNLFPGPGTDKDRQYARRVLGTTGSKEQLRKSTIMYAMSDAGWWMPSHFWAKDAADFSAALPLAITPNEYTRTYMTIPEDLRGADINVTAEVRVDFTGLTKDSTPSILFGSANFGPQTDGEEIGNIRRYKCRVPLQAISPGRNRVMVKAAEDGAKLAGVELWIRRD